MPVDAVIQASSLIMYVKLDIEILPTVLANMFCVF